MDAHFLESRTSCLLSLGVDSRFDTLDTFGMLDGTELKTARCSCIEADSDNRRIEMTLKCDAELKRPISWHIEFVKW